MLKVNFSASGSGFRSPIFPGVGELVTPRCLAFKKLTREMSIAVGDHAVIPWQLQHARLRTWPCVLLLDLADPQCRLRLVNTYPSNLYSHLLLRVRPLTC
jgi:hypothetical protein